MQDEFATLLDEYDALLLKADKSEDDLRRIRLIEVGALQSFGFFIAAGAWLNEPDDNPQGETI